MPLFLLVQVDGLWRQLVQRNQVRRVLPLPCWMRRDTILQESKPMAMDVRVRQDENVLWAVHWDRWMLDIVILLLCFLHRHPVGKAIEEVLTEVFTGRRNRIRMGIDLWQRLGKPIIRRLRVQWTVLHEWSSLPQRLIHSQVHQGLPGNIRWRSSLERQSLGTKTWWGRQLAWIPRPGLRPDRQLEDVWVHLCNIRSKCQGKWTNKFNIHFHMQVFLGRRVEWLLRNTPRYEKIRWRGFVHQEHPREQLMPHTWPKRLARPERKLQQRQLRWMDGSSYRSVRNELLAIRQRRQPRQCGVHQWVIQRQSEELVEGCSLDGSEVHGGHLCTHRNVSLSW